MDIDTSYMMLLPFSLPLFSVVLFWQSIPGFEIYNQSSSRYLSRTASPMHALLSQGPEVRKLAVCVCVYIRTRRRYFSWTPDREGCNLHTIITCLHLSYPTYSFRELTVFFPPQASLSTNVRTSQHLISSPICEPLSVR
jgi:hypothetical protein